MKTLSLKYLVPYSYITIEIKNIPSSQYLGYVVSYSYYDNIFLMFMIIVHDFDCSV